MSAELNATFEIKSWDEQPYDEADGEARLARATVTKEYSGDIEGTSLTEWLMASEVQPVDAEGPAPAAFVGIERIRGTVGGRAGTLVLRHVGTFRDGAAKAELTVVSGTGDLDGATGSGSFVADPSGRVALALET
jgi:hypothetical protein